MPLKGSPFVGREDALEGAVVDSTAQGQHVVGLLKIPPSARTLQPYMTDTFVGCLDAPTADRIAALAGSAGVQPLGTVPPKADQLPDLLGGLIIARLQGFQPLDRPVYIPPEQAGHHGFHPLALLHRILGEL